MTKMTMGVIVSQQRSANRSGIIHNKVEYEVDGYTYTIKQDGDWRNSRLIQVHYNPQRPQRAYAGARPDAFMSAVVFAICGLVALAYPLYKRFL